ncbi:MAG TPA: OmpA family protein [Methylocystis sp.]|nr:OmpA family protein [Methylocystis sp.]
MTSSKARSGSRKCSKTSFVLPCAARSSARYLRSSSTNPRDVYLVGFADSVGGWGRNEALGKQRAQGVADRLRDAGFPIPSRNVRSLSYLAPVACNPTDAHDANNPSLAKNRRVEVWIETR